MNQASFFQKKWVILIAATIACILWGSAFPALKVSYQALNINGQPYTWKLQFAGYRFLLASLYIFAFMVMTKRSLRIPLSQIPTLLLLGFVQTSMQYYFFYNGLANITGMKGAIMTSMGTFFSVILPHFFYHNDKMTRNKWLGLLIGFAGVIWINLSKGPLGSGFSLTGEGFLIGAALMGAIASIMAKETSAKVETIAMTGYQMLFGSLMLIGFSFVQLGQNVIVMDMSMVPLFLHLALISSAGFCLWFTLLQHNPVSQVSIYKFQIPIWGTLLSAIFIQGETITPHIVSALVLVSLGILLVNRPDKTKPKTVNQSA